MQHIQTPAIKLAKWLNHHRHGLLSASRLLGGAKAECRTLDLLDCVGADLPLLSRRTERLLVALHELLTLQHVGDRDRVEGDFFAMIDPSKPVVEEICLLADGLLEQMRNYAAVRPEGPIARAA